MALAYRDSLSGGDSTFTVTNVNVAAPTVAIGDLEIVWAAAAVLAPGTAPTISTPSGWNLGGTGASVPSAGGLVNTRAHLFWRISPNTGAVVNLNAGTTAVFVYVRLSYSGGPATTALRQVSFGSTGAATSIALPSLTANAGTMLSAFVSLGAAQTMTAPGSMTARQNNGTYGVNASDEQIAAAGATGTRTFTWSSSSESVGGIAEFRATHAATGALVGPGSTVAGSAARTRAHPSSGSLTGQGSLVVGSAQRNAAHSASGDLTGPGSAISGSANRTRAHPASGDLTGQGSALAGAAARTRAHPTSGVLVGPGSVLDGAAARTRVHPASGDLVGQGAVIVGSADHQGAAGVHDTTGALVGQGSAVAGTAARLRAFAASGALVGQGSAIAGSAARVAGPVSHATSGALVGAGSAVAGSAARTGAAVTHDTSGNLVGPGAVITGQDVDPDIVELLGGGPGLPKKKKKRVVRTELDKDSYLYRLLSPEVRAQIEPEVAEVIEAKAVEVVEQKAKPSPKAVRVALADEGLAYRQAYKEIYLELIGEIRKAQEDEEEEEAIAMALIL